MIRNPCGSQKQSEIGKLAKVTEEVEFPQRIWFTYHLQVPQSSEYSPITRAKTLITTPAWYLLKKSVVKQRCNFGRLTWLCGFGIATLMFFVERYHLRTFPQIACSLKLNPIRRDVRVSFVMWFFRTFSFFSIISLSEQARDRNPESQIWNLAVKFECWVVRSPPEIRNYDHVGSITTRAVSRGSGTSVFRNDADYVRNLCVKMEFCKAIFLFCILRPTTVLCYLRRSFCGKVIQSLETKSFASKSASNPYQIATVDVSVEHLEASVSSVLVAIDLGLRSGFAFYNSSGSLIDFTDHRFRAGGDLTESILAEIEKWSNKYNLTHFALEGDKFYQAVWTAAINRFAEERNKEREIIYVAPAEWRECVLLTKERKSGKDAKIAARQISRQIMWRSGASMSPFPKIIHLMLHLALKIYILRHAYMRELTSYVAINIRL